MNVGIEVSTLGQRTTGTNRYLECMIEQLEETQNRLFRFSPFYSGSSKVISKYSEKRYVRHFYRGFLLKKEIENSDVDCAIFPDYFMPTGFRKPAAIVIHDLSFISHPQFYSRKFATYYSYKLKQTLKENPVIIAVSGHTKKNIVNYLNVKGNDVKIVQGYSKFYPVKPGFSSADVDANPYFLYVGHIEPRKNLRFMIEGFLSWKQHSNSSYSLKIIGETWIKNKEVKNILTKYRDHPDIIFEGYVTDDKLKSAYQNAAGFIHTSHEEGFGFPVLEAMHYRLPVLCSKNIATAEISLPNSITIKPDDKLEFYNGLEKLAEAAEEKKKIEYDIKYSPGLMKEQLAEVLDELERRVNKISAPVVSKAGNIYVAIEKTLVYSGLFNSGIRKERLREFIFDYKCGEEELERGLLHLVKDNKVEIKGDFVSLKNSLTGFYSKSNKRINRLKLIKILNFLQKLPFVSSIAFSGGTSHYGLENHDDVDLFIITKPWTVYLVYFIIHLYSVLFKTRRELCANFLIDENALEITHSFDIYTAHQIISLTSFKNQKMLNVFWNKNKWVKNIFPNFHIPDTEYKRAPGFYKMYKPLNSLLMLFYRRFYSEKLKKYENHNSLKLNKNCIKLHTNDHRDRIINEFRKTLEIYADINNEEKLATEKVLNV